MKNRQKKTFLSGATKKQTGLLGLSEALSSKTHENSYEKTYFWKEKSVEVRPQLTIIKILNTGLDIFTITAK